MHLRKSIGAALAMTLINGCMAARAASGDQTAASASSAAAKSAVAVSAIDGGIKNIMDAVTPHTGLVQDSKSNAPMVEKYLLDGKLADGEIALNARLKENSRDDQARFGLGVLQFLQAIEGLGQDLYRYGLRDMSQSGLRIQFLTLQVPVSTAPQKINYQQLRKLVDNFRQKLVQAESTLALITDANVKLPLHFGMIRLDLKGDGRNDEDKDLWKVYAHVTNQTDIPIEKAKAFYIKFDRGDVHWLRGYCHLLSSVCDMFLAYDSEETFNYTGHLFFTRVESPYKDLGSSKHFRNLGGNNTEVLDLVALIHLIRWNVVEPQRMEAALHHLEAVITQSRETWKWIMAETDDDHEWLPNPRQTGVIPNMQVTLPMVTAWAEIMNESERILSGKLLIPYWRGDGSQGVNLRKVFLEPRTFDFVLWVQGSAAVPYLQKGEMTKGETWRQLRSEFGNQFPGFALFFN